MALATSREQDLKTVACQAELDTHDCKRFLTADRETAGYMKRCPSDAAVPRSFFQLAVICGIQTVMPTVDLATSMYSFIAVGMKQTDENRQIFVNSCEHDSNFKTNAARTVPVYKDMSETEIRRIPCWQLVADFEDANERQRSYQTVDNAEKKYREYLSRPRPTTEESSERHPFLDFIKSNRDKLACLNEAGKTELLCYGFFSVVDPTLVAGTAIKGARLAGLFAKVGEAQKVTRTVDGLTEAVKTGTTGSASSGTNTTSSASEAVQAISATGATTSPQAPTSFLAPTGAKAFTQEGLKRALIERAYEYRFVDFGEKEAMYQLYSLDQALPFLQADKLRSLMAKLKKFGGENEFVEALMANTSAEKKLAELQKIMDAAESRFYSKAHPEVLSESTLRRFYSSLPESDKIVSLRTLAGEGGTEVENGIITLIKNGKMREAAEIAESYTNKSISLSEARQKMAGLRGEVSQGILSAANDLPKVNASSVSAARETELAGLGDFQTYRAATSDVVAVRAQYPLLGENIDKASAKLRQLNLKPQVQEASQLPLSEKMKARLDTLTSNQRKGLAVVWNKLNDAKAFAEYSARLAEDAAVEMRRAGGAANLDALARGEVTRNAVMKVLVKRHRAQGNSSFSSITRGDFPSRQTRKASSNDGFREAVMQGPFFDKPFDGSRHGIDAHFLQLDYVSSEISKVTNGNPREFWDMVGSKKGINYWVPLFDNQGDTLTTPEFLSHQVSGFLRITD